MLVFIDDSGDAGFKLDRGSSKFFVISCVIFEDDLEVLKTSVAIKELRRKLKLADYREFKFNSTTKKIRAEFLRTINQFKFSVRCVVVDKVLIKSYELKSRTEAFYSYTIKLVLKHSGGSILNAKIRIDGSGSREFRKNFVTYLRKELNSKEKTIMKNCKLVDSKTNDLIQMADMIAGSIRRSYESNKTDSKEYKQIFQKHIVDEWKFK